MNKIKVGIFGPNGRMGSDILKYIVKYPKLELTSLCERKDNKLLGKLISNVLVEDSIHNLVNNSDVIIDFTTPKATIDLLKVIKAIKPNTAVVTGTTGYTKNEERKFNSLIKGLTILRSFNMSIGINLLKNLINQTSNRIGLESDIEVVEIHHNKKRDTPSGTAISLAESIKEGNKKISKFYFREKNNNRVRKKNEIGFSSIRGGDVIGEHSVYFFLDGEKIELKHVASNRKIFSNGALQAANWIYKKKPGLYTILDMINI